MANATPQTDKDITAFAAAELMALPALVRTAETLLADLGQTVRATKQLLAEAETDAQINATVTGKNAESRKLELEAAVNSSAAVTTCRGQLAALEQAYAAADVDYSSLHRRWKSAMALAELQAAKIRYLATFEPKSK